MILAIQAIFDWTIYIFNENKNSNKEAIKMKCYASWQSRVGR